MWCSSATVLLVLAVVIVSGVCFNQDSCYSSSSTFSPASSTSERVAAPKPDRESHVAVVAIVIAVVVPIVVIIPVIAAAALVAVAVPTHARAIVPTTCRVLDDSIRRVCWAHLLPASD